MWWQVGWLIALVVLACAAPAIPSKPGSSGALSPADAEATVQMIRATATAGAIEDAERVAVEVAATGTAIALRAEQLDEAIAHLETADEWYAEGHLGFALEEARQALAFVPDYADAQAFIAEVAPQATATAVTGQQAVARLTATAQARTARAPAQPPAPPVAAPPPPPVAPMAPSASQGGSTGGGSGCGSRGGPGYRLANGKCASHEDARRGRR
jgi:hypothetical protein